MASVVLAPPSSSAPAWDEQIVPTLKKRLETESQYLSNRISTSGPQGNPNAHAGGDSKAQTRATKARPEDAAPEAATGARQRTKSSPFHEPLRQPGPSHAGPSRIPVLSRPTTGSRKTGASPASSRRPSYNEASDSDGAYPPSRIPRPQPGPRRPSGSSAISATISDTPPESPSLAAVGISGRTISRPRSKSTLAPRPKVARAASSSTSESRNRLPPSGIPLSKHSIPDGQEAPPATALGSSIEREQRFLSPHGSGSGDRGQEVLRHRKSFDLSTKEFLEPDLRDELPPFKLAPDEAMRIARHGHDLRGQAHGADSADTEGDESHRDEGEGSEGSSSSKRIRVESTHPTGASKAAGGAALSIGLGHAPSRSTGIAYKSNGGISGQQRSVTTGTRSALNSSQTSTSRSISLSTLSAGATAVPTPPRYGVAAHLVPPESAYTPPKGANWDDVVLPALAKKIGLGEEPRIGVDDMEEGDFAVEWDKHGTPMKWVKRQHHPHSTETHPLGASTTSASSRGASHGPRDPLSEYADYNNIPRSRSAFSPTFEPSPENPLHARPVVAGERTDPPTPTPAPGASHQPHPSLRQKNSFPGTPSTTEPFSQSSPGVPQGLPLEPGHTPHHTSPHPEEALGSGAGAGSRMQRKPSTLRKPVPPLSHQASGGSLRHQSQSQYSYRAGGSVTAAPQGLVRPADVAWDRQEREGQARAQQQHQQQQQQQQHSAGAAHSGVRGAKSTQAVRGDMDGSHGKGCGCVVM